MSPGSPLPDASPDLEVLNEAESGLGSWLKI